MMMSKENMIESAKEFIGEKMKQNDPSHDWTHVERVYRNAMHIAEQERTINKLEFDLEVVQLAALFHDLVDFKYDHDSAKSLDEVAHDRLADFFRHFPSFPSNKINHIHYIIMNISWRKELEADQLGISQKLTPELKIVRDADRLDAIGAIGVGRCFAFAGHKRRPFYECHESLMRMANQTMENGEMMSYEKYNEQTVRNEGGTLGHFYEKLFFIAERMQTETGKKLASQRHDFMKSFVKQFYNEIV